MKFILPFLLFFVYGAVFAQGDIEKGKQTFVICAACHGDQAQGNEDFDAPRLQGQYDWYMLTQLEKFKSGIRGANEDDDGGQVMIGIVETIDEQAIEDVVAYIATLKPLELESNE